MTREIIMLFVITLCVSVLSSCKKDEADSERQPIDDGRPNARGEHLPAELKEKQKAFEDAWKKARTDTDRWRLVEETSKGAYKPEGYAGSEVEFQVRYSILGLSRQGEFWYENFPNITRHVEFDLADIEHLAKYLGSNKRHVYGGARRNFGELSQAWLHLLTGEKFKGKQAFDAWLEQNRDFLVWNQSEGRFEIRSAGDSGPRKPSTEPSP